MHRCSHSWQQKRDWKANRKGECQQQGIGACLHVQTEIAHFGLDSKTEARKGQYNLQLVKALHSIIAEISHSRSCFATKNAELYITWEAWKLLNRTKSLAEKKDILKSLVVPGKRPATAQQISSRKLHSILHQISDN